MKMKNKLALHHKSKFGLVMRNFSIALASFSFALAAVVIPTYISIVGDKNVPTQAEESKMRQEQEENLEEEPLLTQE